MNPEEGELRPQLLDRFGLNVEMSNCFDAQTRQRIVKTRLAFDADPHAFRASHASAQAALEARIHAARNTLATLDFDDLVHARVSALCIEAHVDGMRADLVMLRAARALAALEDASDIDVQHVERVADAVLRHRRREHDDAPSQQAQRAPRDTATSQSDSDWGYVPPEPAGTAKVKQVRPLAAKKA
jgi:magnesium chelatase subunit I